MNTKSLLSIGENFFKLLKIFIVLFSIFLVGLFIYSFISPNTFGKLIIFYQDGDYQYDYIFAAPNPPNTLAEYNTGNNKLIYYNKLVVSSKLDILIRSIIPLFLTFYIFKNIVFFFNSVKNYSTFFINNSKYFRNIGILLALIYLFKLASKIINGDLSMAFPDGYLRFIFSRFDINLPELLLYASLIILSFIISLVFKEGENLRVENQLTI